MDLFLGWSSIGGIFDIAGMGFSDDQEFDCTAITFYCHGTHVFGFVSNIDHLSQVILVLDWVWMNQYVIMVSYIYDYIILYIYIYMIIYMIIYIRLYI